MASVCSSLGSRCLPPRCSYKIESIPGSNGVVLNKGPEVPRIGLGMAALGRPGYINLGHTADLAAGKGVEEMRKQSWEVLDAAYEAGVRAGAAPQVLKGNSFSHRLSEVFSGLPCCHVLKSMLKFHDL